MAIRYISIENQLKIVRKAKFYFLREFYVSFKKDTNKKTAGLCRFIERAYRYYYDKDTFFLFIKLSIPLFTYSNACLFSKAEIHCSGYWWDRHNRVDRLAFLDWMISELEKQLKD